MGKILVLLGIIFGCTAFGLGIWTLSYLQAQEKFLYPRGRALTENWRYHHPLIIPPQENFVKAELRVPRRLLDITPIESFLVYDEDGLWVPSMPLLPKNTKPIVPQKITADTTTVTEGYSVENLISGEGKGWRPDISRDRKQAVLNITFDRPQRIGGMYLAPESGTSGDITQITLASGETTLGTYYSVPAGLLTFRPLIVSSLTLRIEFNEPFGLRVVEFYSPESLPEGFSFIADPDRNYFLRWNVDNIRPVIPISSWTGQAVTTKDTAVIAVDAREKVPIESDDSDNDGIPNALDNCPLHRNPNQEGEKRRGIACDPRYINPLPLWPWFIWGGALILSLGGVYIARQYISSERIDSD